MEAMQSKTNQTENINESLGIIEFSDAILFPLLVIGGGKTYYIQHLLVYPLFLFRLLTVWHHLITLGEKMNKHYE